MPIMPKIVGLIHIWIPIHSRAGVHDPLGSFQLRLFCKFFETWAVAQIAGYSSALLSSYTKMSFGTKQQEGALPANCLHVITTL